MQCSCKGEREREGASEQCEEETVGAAEKGKRCTEKIEVQE